MTEISLQLRRLGQTAFRIDRVVVAFAIVVVLVALLDPAQLRASLEFTALSLRDTAPFLFLSIGIAAYAGASGADSIISRAFSGHPVKMVFTAAAFGALSPFCSCGVIPLIAALLSMGVPLAPVMAFWLASPVIDPAMFVLTAGTISYEFAIFKLGAAIFLGLSGGFVTMWLASAGLLSEPLRDGVGNGGCGGAKIRSPNSPVWAFWRERDRIAKFRKTAISTTLFLGKWLAFAFLLESLMMAYVPADRISALLGGAGMLPILTATLVGVPAYLNGYAALPRVSGLMEQGMQTGAGMAFLVAGGVSSIPAAIAVCALVKRQIFVLYLAYALIGSFVVGIFAQIGLG